jgi:hypothetical protein
VDINTWKNILKNYSFLPSFPHLSPSVGGSWISSLLYLVIWFCKITESSAHPLCARVTSCESREKLNFFFRPRHSILSVVENFQDEKKVDCDVLKNLIRIYLSHSSEESLRIEESCHPEDLGPVMCAPRAELWVSFQQLRVPETQCCRFPGDLEKIFLIAIYLCKCCLFIIHAIIILHQCNCDSEIFCVRKISSWNATWQTMDWNCDVISLKY